jgi:hypothetical protein
MNFFEFNDNLQKYSPARLLLDLQLELEKNNDAVNLQKEQWQSGVDANGKLLGKYSQMTEILSGGRKQAGTPFTLFDTGNFYEETKLFGNQKQNDLLFNFDSSGINTNALIERLGERIFGLTKPHIDTFTEIAQDTAIELLNKNLKLK